MVTKIKATAPAPDRRSALRYRLAGLFAHDGRLRLCANGLASRAKVMRIGVPAARRPHEAKGEAAPMIRRFGVRARSPPPPCRIIFATRRAIRLREAFELPGTPIRITLAREGQSVRAQRKRPIVSEEAGEAIAQSAARSGAVRRLFFVTSSSTCSHSA